MKISQGDLFYIVQPSKEKDPNPQNLFPLRKKSEKFFKDFFPIFPKVKLFKNYSKPNFLREILGFFLDDTLTLHRDN